MENESNVFGFARTFLAQHTDALVLILIEQTAIGEIGEAVTGNIPIEMDVSDSIDANE